MSSPAKVSYLADALRRAGLDAQTCKNHSSKSDDASLPIMDYLGGNDVVRMHKDQDIRNIFQELQKLDISASEIIYD